MTTTWHAPPELLASYLEGRLDAVVGASLERHVDRCAHCRAQVRPLSDAALLDAGWSALRTGIEQPRLPAPLRLAHRLGLREPTAIVLAAAASLRMAWFSGAIVALGFATAATALSDGLLWPFLLVAPLMPVLGVAAAYGASDDAVEVLAVTAPYGRDRLVLVRTGGVLASTLPIAGLLGLLLPGPTWVAAAWFGPALAMVAVVLALAGVVGPRLAAGIVSVVWAAVVTASVRTLPQTWPVEVDRQVAYLVLGLLALGVLALRSHRTRRIGAVL